MRKTWMLAAMVALAGCSTSPVMVKDATLAPQDRIYAFDKATDGDAVITIVRDEGFTGAGCRLQVSVDGKAAALLSTSEKVSLYVPSGVFVLGVSPAGAGLCSSGLATRNARSAQVLIKHGEHLVYRIATDSNGTIGVGPENL